MPVGKRLPSQLEHIDLRQQNWTDSYNRNAERLNDILLYVDGLLDVDINALTDDDVLWWNSSTSKFENIAKHSAISESSESSDASPSSESSESSESSTSSESSESSVSITI